MAKIYTRNGDTGTTTLYTGQKISKDSAIIEFIGKIDMLNAELGLCVTKLENIPGVDFTLECEALEDIQKDLFLVGAIASGAGLNFSSQNEVSNIEKTIDDYVNILPKLNNFILPGGSEASAQLQVARVYSRELERFAVRMNSNSVKVFLPYLNRLSDLLFVMARYVNYKQKIKEKTWKEQK